MKIFFGNFLLMVLMMSDYFAWFYYLEASSKVVLDKSSFATCSRGSDILCGAVLAERQAITGYCDTWEDEKMDIITNGWVVVVADATPSHSL